MRSGGPVVSKQFGRLRWVLTSVNDVLVVEVVDSVKHLANGLGSVLFSKLSLLANAVEQLAAGCQLGDNVVFVLYASAPGPQTSHRVQRIPSTRTSHGT